MKKSGSVKKIKLAAANLIFVLTTLISFFIIIPQGFTQTNKFEPPPEADKIKNPLAGNESSALEGKALYKSYCTPCHGDKGKGDGVAAAGLSVKPADHTSNAVQKQTDGALFWELSEGHNPMPAYKTSLSETQRWQLVNYIRTLAKPQKK